MRRRLYLITLVCLQGALLVKLIPVLAHALSIESAIGLAPRGWPALVQIVATAAAVAGATVALIFPSLALVRHRQGGPLRFHGLPRWSIALALGGGLALCSGVSLLALARAVPIDVGAMLAWSSQSIIAAGIALASGGVLCSEISHRAIAMARATARDGGRRESRVDITHPPDLRARVA